MNREQALPYVRLDDDEAEDIAKDYLQERKWFVDNDNPPDADYII